MVAPAHLVQNRAIGADHDELQAVIIDFGQSVDVRHPESIDLLQRDLERVQMFFKRVGVETMAVEEALLFVTEPAEAAVAEQTE